jgi:hypothetical protein
LRIEPGASRLVGIRKDKYLQIALVSSYRRIGPLPGLHGLFTVKMYSNRYFLEGADFMRRELVFLRDESRVEESGCLPVQRTDLWLSYGQVSEPRVESKLEVLLFDNTHIVRRRILDFQPTEGGEKDDWLEHGNRTLIFRTSEGYMAYDVTTDTVTPWKGAE